MDAATALSQGIWAGEVKRVEEARSRYEADPQSKFWEWASTLYSFRSNLRFRDDLLGLAPNLIAKGEEIVAEYKKQQLSRELLVRAELASELLYWLWQTPTSWGQQASLLTRALLDVGLQTAEQLPAMPGDHVVALLYTTCVKYLEEDEHRPVYKSEEYLRNVLVLAPNIKDRRQRARVWRRIAAIYRNRADFRWLWYVGRALLQPVPWAVHEKTLAFVLWARE